MKHLIELNDFKSWLEEKPEIEFCHQHGKTSKSLSVNINHTYIVRKDAEIVHMGGSPLVAVSFYNSIV